MKQFSLDGMLQIIFQINTGADDCMFLLSAFNDLCKSLIIVYFLKKT